MNRTRDVQRHHRERVIAKRFGAASRFGRYADILDGQNGRLHKEPFVWPFDGPRPTRKNYLASGFCRRDWDDVDPSRNIRQALKRDTRRQYEEVA